MAILAGRMPQMSVRNTIPGNAATSSGRNNKVSAPRAEISNLVSIIVALIDYGVPITRLMASGSLETAPHQLAADHPVEIAMRHQGGDPGLPRPCDQDVGGLGGAPRRAPRRLDPRMKTRMPQDAGHHRPFGNPHPQQRQARQTGVTAL